MSGPSSAACASDGELVALIEGRLDGPTLARLKEHVPEIPVLGTGKLDLRALKQLAIEKTSHTAA